MWQLVLAAVGVMLVVALAVVWLVPRVGYRITRRHLDVTLLGVRVRRLPLADIRTISARRLHRGEWGEQWWNTWRPSHRVLTLHRRKGLFRRFVITPKRRYIFRAELKQAMAQLALAVPGSDDGPEALPEGEAAARSDPARLLPDPNCSEPKAPGGL